MRALLTGTKMVVGIVTGILLVADACAFDLGSAMRALPLGKKQDANTNAEPKPTRLLSEEDKQIERDLVVFLGEPPISVVRDTTCEKVAANTPADVLKNTLGSTLTSASGTKFLKNLLKKNAQIGTSRDETLKTAKLELKKQVWLPLAVETQTGQRLLDQRKDMILTKEDPMAVDAYAAVTPIFDFLVSTVSSVQPFRPQLFIVDDGNSQPNAEALPGGIVLVNFTLAQTEPERISGYMAHEFGHIVKRHHTMALQANLIDSVNSIEAIRDLLKSPDDDLVDKIIAGINLQGVAFTRYFSNQELEADGCGAKFLASTLKIDGMKAISLFLDDVESTSAKPTQAAKHKSLPFKKQHPLYDDRKKTLEGNYRHWQVKMAKAGSSPR